MSSFPSTAPSAPRPTSGSAGSGTKAQSNANRNQFERYLPIVRRIAMKLVRRLPRQIAIDDLIGAGWVGLAEAMRRRGEIGTEDEFEAYAAYRIKGSILDYLRSLDPMTRKTRGASNQITGAIRTLTGRLGRSPTENEIADELGVALETYQELLYQIAQADPARLELTDLHGVSASNDLAPDLIASKRELAERIEEAVESMPQRLQLVLALYYQEECSLREVGKVLGVTEARACQLHSEAIHRIRAHIEQTRGYEEGR